jgi:hypothetical protein
VANLNTPLTDAEIRNLDYFDKARLYHNVYINYKYSALPAELRQFRLEDNGFKVAQSIIGGQNIKEPYAIVKLLKVLKPENPKTYQQIYRRAAFLADLCDTTVSKIIKSGLFDTYNFIPKLNSDVAQFIINSKGVGTVQELKASDYTPYTPDEGGDGGSTDKESHIVFSMGINNALTCDTTFDKVVEKLPDIPAAELVYNAENDYQNIVSISSGYDRARNCVDFNFIRMYEDTLELLTVHYSAAQLTYEINELVINGGNTNGGTTITFPTNLN